MVEISLTDGGLTRIVVKDNGSGISEKETLLICQRNVTSKISSTDDLGSLSSFGFRGEALNSIATLSKAFYIQTKIDGSKIGTKFLFDQASQTIKKIENLPLEV